MNNSRVQYKGSSGQEQEDALHGLFENILERIDKERIRRVERRIVLICAGLAVSVGILIPVFERMRTALVDSGFMQLASLVFSDSGIVFSEWRNFSIAVLESLPILNIVAFLSVIFVVLNLLRFVAADWDKVVRRRGYSIL